MNKRGHPLAVGKVELGETKALGFGELRAARLLQRRIVVSIHVVEPDDVTAVSQKPPRDVKADKAGGAGDENRTVSHRSRPASVLSTL